MTITTENQPADLVRVTRSGIVEELHRGSIVIVHAGKVIKSIGDANVITPTRSTAKPFQLLELIIRGGIEAFNLSEKEIALMVSSHNGEDEHLKIARNILSRTDFVETDLDCGIHPPFYFSITHDIYNKNLNGPTQLHNNCSGKHIGILLLCKLVNIDAHDYFKSSHPVQKIIVPRVLDIFGVSNTTGSIGVDGCGIPTFNVPLSHVAQAYSYLAKPERYSSSFEVIIRAMMTYPFIIAGSNRLDTDLMSMKRVIAKSGAQGIYCLALPDEDLSIAIKMESGSEPASECVAVEILRQLGMITQEESIDLEPYWHFPVKTWTGKTVGRYEPCF